MILSLETSTSVCSVALHQKDKLIAYSELFIDKSHAEVLTIMIRNLLEHAQVPMKALRAVAISKGPGSYTGLRIGTSAAKGICFALDIPLYAVETLRCLSQEVMQYVSTKNALFCPMLDARRMEVYTALYRSDFSVLRPTEAYILDQNAFSTELEKHEIHFFGNGAFKFEQINVHTHAIFWKNIYPSAKFVGALVTQNQYETVDIAYFEPFYLKPFFTKPSKKVALGHVPKSNH